MKKCPIGVGSSGVPTPAGADKTFRSSSYSDRRVVVRLMTIRYAVVRSVTSRVRSHAVAPSGRWARRTLVHPERVAMTGRTDGLPYQVPGTRPRTGPPGHAYRSAENLRVASSVVPRAGAAGNPLAVQAATASASTKRFQYLPIPVIPAAASPMIPAL